MKRLVYFGSTDFGLPSLARLMADPLYDVVGVVSQPDRPAGRGQSVQPTATSAFALAQRLPLWRWETLRTPAVYDQLAALRPDVLIVAAYGLIVPPEILELTPRRAINIHASLLPTYRGASPINAALFNGDTETGVTFMVMTPRLDDGDIIQQYHHPITTEKFPELSAALATLAAEHICQDVTDYVAGVITARPQDAAFATITKKISRTDGQCAWESALTEVRRLRAYLPWPGSWTTWNGERLKFLDAAWLDRVTEDTPGRVVALDDKDTWGIVCHQGIFVPRTIQFAGRQAQPATIAYARPAFVGSVLGS